MRKTTHVKMFILGLVGAFLTFRKEIHDFTRIEHEDREEEELKKIQQKYLALSEIQPKP